MGVQGLRKLIESSGCARQLPNLPTPGQVATSSAASSHSHSSSAASSHSNNNDMVRELFFEQQQQQQENASSSSETMTTTRKAVINADHVLIDMNCIIHGSFNRTQPDAQTTIRCVLKSLEYLLAVVVNARRTLVLCFDGPAPTAKLATQRIRRRKVSHLDVANNVNFSDLSITTGSVFMLQLEQHVTQFFNQAQTAAQTASANVRRERKNQQQQPQKYQQQQQHQVSDDVDPILATIGKTNNISISGSSVPGEGEAKIGEALSRIAATVAKNENDSVVVIGNDIDLVLTCIGATSFHNIGVLNPSTMQVIDVGSFLARWVSPDEEPISSTSSSNQQQNKNKKNKKNSNLTTEKQQNEDSDNDDDDDGNNNNKNFNYDIGFVKFAALPGVRIDFVWLFMLNGSDYYDGLGDAAMSLWKRYRMLKKERGADFRLVSKTHCLITHSLRLLFQCDQITVEDENNDDDGESGRGGGKRGKSKSSKSKRRGRGGGAGGDKFDDDIQDDERENTDLSGSSRRNNKSSLAESITSEQRQASHGLLNSSLWSLITTVNGRCPNYRFRPVDPKQMQEATYVTNSTLRATVAGITQQAIRFRVPKYFKGYHHQNNQQKRNKKRSYTEDDDDNDNNEEEAAEYENYNNEQEEEDADVEEEYFEEDNNTNNYNNNYQQQQQQQQQNPFAEINRALDPNSNTSPLSPLQTFCALMPRLDLLPKPVQKVLEKNYTLERKWQNGIGSELAGAMALVFSKIDFNELSPAERFLSQYGNPIDIKGGFYRGHPNEGRARFDAHTKFRKLYVDFFRFGYGTKSTRDVHFPVVATDLVPGAEKLNEASSAVVEQRKQLRREEQQQKHEQHHQQQQQKQSKNKNKSAGVAAKRAGKKKSVTNTNESSSSSGIDKNARKLYWHDVFSAASRSSVL